MISTFPHEIKSIRPTVSEEFGNRHTDTQTHRRRTYQCYNIDIPLCAILSNASIRARTFNALVWISTSYLEISLHTFYLSVYTFRILCHNWSLLPVFYVYVYIGTELSDWISTTCFTFTICYFKTCIYVYCIVNM